jgi:GTPase SAR1 family protein
LFVFAVNNKDSFDNIINWVNLFKENHNGKENIPMYLVGNKTELGREVQKDVIDEFLCKNKYKYFEISAKENSGIEELFQELSEDLYTILVETSSNKTKRTIPIIHYNKKRNNNLICSII